MALAHMLALAAYVVSCTSFLHWSDPTAQAVTCAITEGILSVLQSIVVATGIPMNVVQVLYGDACAEAAASGLSQHDAEQAGLAATRQRAMRLAQLHARFPNGEDK